MATGRLNITSVKLGDSADPAKSFIISTPAVPDGSLTIERENGTDVLTMDANGLVSVPSGVAGTLRQMTAVASTSGTAIDFTGIPSWVKRITVILARVSTNGVSHLIIQIGAGSPQNTGYSGACSTFNASPGSTGNTTGFIINEANLAPTLSDGIAVLANLSGNVWVESHSIGLSEPGISVGGGSVTLSGTLDRIRITTVNGTDTFDAGTISVMYEG